MWGLTNPDISKLLLFFGFFLRQTIVFMAHAPEANLQWMVLDGQVEAGEVVHREGAGKWKSSGPVVV